MFPETQGGIVALAATQDTLRRNQKALEALLNATDGSAFLLDSQGHFLMLNESAAAKLGGSVAALLGQSVFDYLPPAVANQRKELLEHVVQTRSPLQFKDERDGHWFFHSLYPVFDEQEDVEAVAVFVREITHQKRSEETLRWEYEVNAALSALHAPLISPWSSIEDVANAALDAAKRPTGSEHGYVAEIDPTTRNLVSHTLTKMMGETCEVAKEKQTIVFPIAADGLYGSLWGHALNTREASMATAQARHRGNRREGLLTPGPG
ncbi:MAG: PAS domain-containing protein [Deltaproteobacteria bacterium]|nr:PAS domain-containing protein [Deltaproteobacteria bacterium]